MQMHLYSDNCQYSHRVRLVMAIKGVSAEVEYISGKQRPQRLLELNPKGNLPTLEDRDVLLYESWVILEYLEDRYPYPQLMPVFPVDRAKHRQLAHRIHTDLCWHGDRIEQGTKLQASKSRKELRSNLMALMPLFDANEWFGSEEFTLVDCCIAPLLWRLPLLGINIQQSPRTLPLLRYCKKLFELEVFVPSLSDAERRMR